MTPKDSQSIPVDWEGFCSSLRQEVSSAKSQSRQLALVGIHLRQFYLSQALDGAAGGNAQISETLRVIEASFREGYLVGRIAPDTVVVILPKVPLPELLPASAKNLVDRLAQSDGQTNGSLIDASVVVTIFPEHGEDADSLLCELNFLLRRNDRKALAHHVPSAPRLPRHVARMEMRHRLRQALTDHVMVLNYQPKIDLSTLKPVSCEALMRWPQDDGSVIRPTDFIRAAEATGEIHKLTEWAIHTALREIADLPDSCSVAVNISAASLYDPEFVQAVTSALAIWDLPPERFILEITETMLLSSPETSFRHLNELRELGLKVAIDDFGTGFSSLSYFKAIPADELKIDQSFVVGMKDNQDDEKIVSLIIELAHKFGLKVVAEGIENRQVLVRLRELGCDIGQGFFLAKPMPFDAYKSWLERFRRRELHTSPQV